MRAVRHRLWVLAIVAGCNQVYGLDPTHAVDAAYFDAPADAPAVCPGPGAAPRFSRLVHQLVLQDCTEYTVSTDSPRALAFCTPIIGSTAVSESDLGADTMTEAAGFPSGGTVYSDMPRLLPEGDEAIARVSDSASGLVTIGTFRRVNGTWVRGADLPIPIGLPDHLGTASRGPLRHLVMLKNNDYLIHEWRFDGTSWAERSPYDAKPEVMFGFGPRMSADGLRLVFTGYAMNTPRKAAFFAQRPDIMSPFGRPQVMPGVPGIDYIFLSEDCSRLYFSAISSVFYVQAE